MDGAMFDRLARALWKRIDRRRVATLVGALAGLLGLRWAGALQTDETEPADDPLTDREARLAEVQARKDEKKLRVQQRRSAKRLKRQTREDRRRVRLSANREAADRAYGPELQLDLQFTNEGGTAVDEVRVTNLDDVNVALTRIETIQAPSDETDLTTSQFTIRPGGSYSFVSGLQAENAADADNGEFRWSSGRACEAPVAGQGYRIRASFSFEATNHDFEILCDGPQTVRFVRETGGTGGGKRKKDRRKRGNQQRKKKR